MDYLVGESASESQGSSESSSTSKQAMLAGGAPMVAAPAPAGPVDTSIVDMCFDLSSFDPLQLDQLTASAGYANAAPAQQTLDLQTQQAQQQQQYLHALQAFTQPATAALQSIGQQQLQPDASVVSSSDAASQAQQYNMPIHPAQVLSAASALQSAMPASVVSTSTLGDKDDDELVKKRPHNWDRMPSEEKRRWERNMREQQRSHKISAQIKDLRSLLTESNVPFKPNKYSILLSVAEYIKQLQSRAIMLDAEHRKLIDTIRVTSEMVNSGTSPDPDDPVGPDVVKEDQGTNLSSDVDMLFVQGLDYLSVFEQCITPMGIAALDGRILACNDAFQSILGYSREELLKHSLFTVMQNHEEVYKAMGEMLKADDTFDSDVALGGEKTEDKPPLFWSGVVGQTKQNKLTANITLVRSSDGSPKFFNCALMIS